MGLKLAGDNKSDDYIPKDDLAKDKAYLNRSDVKAPTKAPPITNIFHKPNVSPREVIHNFVPLCHNKENMQYMAKCILNPNQPQAQVAARSPVITPTQPEPLPWEERTELIMCGTGPTNKQCPYDAETWSVNDAFQSLEMPRCDKLFFFDRMFMDFAFPIGRRSAEIVQAFRAQGIDLTPELAQQYGVQVRKITPQVLNEELPNTEIVSIWMCPDIKNFVILPVWDLVAHFKSDFFTNSFAYMIAYALWLGKYKKIRFYGVDMSNEHEIYRNERGCVEHWIGVAKGMGLDVEVSKGSSVCHREMYGIETD